MTEIAYTSDGWPKLLRNVKDFAVETVRDLSNGYMSIPAGTRGVIIHGSRWTKLHFKAAKCECCGVQMKIHGCSKKDFTPL